jgi:hypothetical protein
VAPGEGLGVLVLGRIAIEVGNKRSLNLERIDRNLQDLRSLSEGPEVCSLLPNGPRLSCGALMKDSFLNLRAPPASSAC